MKSLSLIGLLFIKFDINRLGWLTFTTAKLISGSNVKKYWDLKAEVVQKYLRACLGRPQYHALDLK